MARTKTVGQKRTSMIPALSKKSITISNIEVNSIFSKNCPSRVSKIDGAVASRFDFQSVRDVVSRKRSFGMNRTFCFNLVFSGIGSDVDGELLDQMKASSIIYSADRALEAHVFMPFVRVRLPSIDVYKVDKVLTGRFKVSVNIRILMNGFSP